jgi:hypothetical protein
METSGIVMKIAILLYYFGPHLYIFAFLISSLRDSSKTLSSNQRGMIIWAFTISTTLTLLLANILDLANWKGDTGEFGWFYMINTGGAGYITLIVWLIACTSLCRSLLGSGERAYKSRINLVMILTLAAICLWRAYTMAIMGFISPAGPSVLGYVLAVFPLVPGVNLVLFAIYIYSRRKLTGPARPVIIFSMAWAGALAATIYAKIILAHQAYNALPDVQPEKCFIVTAAARGNRRFVGSELNPITGLMENAQLARMRAFERYLMTESPAAHRLLRKVYNRVGPAVAWRIRRPLVADIAYVMLKPLELLAVVVCGRTALKRKARQ